MKEKLRLIYQQNKGLTFILPSLMGVSLFFLFPYLNVLIQSFMSPMENEGVSLRNYQQVIDNQAFRLAASNTIKFVGVCLPILLSLSLVFALMLRRSSRVTHWLKTGFLFPMVIPVASIAFFWRLVFEKQGLLNLLVSTIGLTPMDWMNTKEAFWLLVFTYVWKNLGYNLILWLAGLSGISESIYEAAQVDGANQWMIFWRITVPNLLPTFFITTVLSTLNTFKIFREAYLVAGEYPHQSMYLIQHVFNNWFREMDISKMAAGSVLNTGVIMGLILLLQRKWGAMDE
ncbi:sugar ABC transporter permease [Enterococcus sp. JM4C]|uniref:carbohydrate ABC transporter permease n=1 Tax=Candidatus Enterococcus huntleyi TaxID=1857217 RepID=UPI00137ABEBC|nr:sugar ABC transporter permease [Enterococcus sp. JM4C]KAF1296210.1 sugar ABC transporter permease [Enterococcus sp. JM4C]